MGASVKPIRSGQKVPVGGRRSNRFPSPIDKAKGYEVVWKNVTVLFESARPYTDVSFVYLIGEDDSGPIKIGLSKDPIARLRGMQTGNPRRLRIEYVLMGTMAVEKLLHELWEPFAIASARNAGKPDAAPGTEWFTPEARATLLPIIETAAVQQSERLTETTDVTVDELERIVRDAHIAHGFVPHVRHQGRRLARGAGYVVSRPSRI